MKRSQPTTKQKTSALMLRKETLRQLEALQLQAVAGGGGRLRVPGGFYDDTTPIYLEEDPG